MESGRTRAFSQLRRFVVVVWWYWVGWLSVEPDPKAKLMGNQDNAASVPLGVQHFFLSNCVKNHQYIESQQLPDLIPALHIMAWWSFFSKQQFFSAAFRRSSRQHLGQFIRKTCNPKISNFKWMVKYLEFLKKKMVALRGQSLNFETTAHLYVWHAQLDTNHHRIFQLRSQLTTMFCGSDLKILAMDRFGQNPGCTIGCEKTSSEINKSLNPCGKSKPLVIGGSTPPVFWITLTNVHDEQLPGWHQIILHQLSSVQCLSNLRRNPQQTRPFLGDVYFSPVISVRIVPWRKSNENW